MLHDFAYYLDRARHRHGHFDQRDPAASHLLHSKPRILRRRRPDHRHQPYRINPRSQFLFVHGGSTSRARPPKEPPAPGPLHSSIIVSLTGIATRHRLAPLAPQTPLHSLSPPDSYAILAL